MSEKLLNVLVIEDNDNDFKLLLRALKKDSLAVDPRRVDTVEQLQDAFREKEWDIVISDNNIPDRRISVQSSLQFARSINPNIPFIIVSGTIGDENAVQLMKLGVQDYILKDNLSRLGHAVKREIADAAIRIKKTETERKLLESQERYRMLAESITDIFFALDRDLRCTFWNSAAEKVTGVKMADAVGKNVFDILPESHNPQLRAKMMGCFTSLTSSTIEIEFNHRNTVLYFQMTVYPSAEMHSVIVKDITDSKEATQKIKAVNDELETFLYRLSHDLRGPVASVQGLINLARSEKLALLESDFFSRINIMANRMDAVISSFQDVVRVKQETPAYQQIHIRELVEKAKQNLDCVNCDFQLTLDQAVSQGKFMTDPEFLIIALENIMENAITYRHPTRKPKLDITFTEKENEFVQILVTDNGIGISSDVIGRIFTMFFRGHAQSSGPGLGLYLAQNAVEKLGGSIRAKSTPDEGSSFSVRLPYDPARLTSVVDQVQVDSPIALAKSRIN